MSQNLIIACPIYFDTKSFLILKERINHLALSDLNIRFIAIDDSAGVDNEILLLKNDKTTEIVSFAYNLGHQSAIVAGLRRVSSSIKDEDIVITMDSDLEDNPEDIKLLIRSYQENPNSVVLAVRTKRKESFLFKIMYLNFKILFKLLTGITINNGNFACYSGKTLKQIIFHPYFNLCYSSTFKALKLKIVEAPCAREKRTIGKSHMNFIGLVAHGFKMLMPFIDIISIRALCLFSSILFLTSALLIAVLYVKFFTLLAIPGWTSNVLLSAIIILILSMTNFFIIFTLFSHSKSFQMNFLHSERNQH